jgi:hypothetical protein
MVVLSAGFASYLSSGYFVYQSTTSGVNLLIGANDDARGNFNSGSVVFEEGKIGYLNNPADMTFQERNSFYTTQAVNWIKENPTRYISMIPTKLFYLFSTNTYSFSPIYNNEEVTSSEIYIRNVIDKALRLELSWREYVVILNQCLYMLILVFAVVSVTLYIKKKMYTQTAMLIMLVILGTGMTIVTVGGARYHYPFLPVFLIFSGWLVNRYFHFNIVSAEESECR